MRYALRLFILGCCLFISGIIVYGQSELRLSGMVVDEMGIPISSAIVRIQTTQHTTHTDSMGRFSLDVITDNEYTLTAWAQGYFNATPVTAYAGDDNIVLILRKHLDEDVPGYRWISAFSTNGDDLNCENCHSSDDQFNASLPFDEWVNDVHANSLKNPRFLTMYTGTDVNGNQSPLTQYTFNRDYGQTPLPPNLAQPYYGAGYLLDFPNSTGNCATCHAPQLAVNTPFEADPRHAEGVVSEGITCDFCHKIWDIKLNPTTQLPYPNMTGTLAYEYRRPDGEVQFFAGPYDDVQGDDTFVSLQTESAFCAGCHHAEFWGVVIYDSYGEWLASPYNNPDTGQTCQDCHMPVGKSEYIAHQAVGGLERDSQTIFSHDMTLSAELFAKTATVTIQTQQQGDELIVTATVINSGAGHHIPTDSPLRQIFLVIEATDGDGNPLALLEGAVLPDWAGNLAGQPGRYYAKLLEQLWTGVFPSGSYWMPVITREDTRIPALGEDVSVYRFSSPDGVDVTITAKLILRRAFSDILTQKGWDFPDVILAQTQNN